VPLAGDFYFGALFMNKLARTFLVIGLLASLNSFTVAVANGQPIVQEVLKRMEDHYNALTSLKASVKMDKFNSQLGEHDISEGSLIFVTQKGRDAAFRIDWAKAADGSIAVVNKQYVMYRPGLGTAYTGSVTGVGGGGKGAPLAFLNMSKAELKANYDISYAGTESVSGGAQTWHLVLTPKTKVSYKSADIWVDKDGMPVQMKQTENNNDTTTILLSSLNKNTKINPKEIQITPAKGTKIVKS